MPHPLGKQGGAYSVGKEHAAPTAACSLSAAQGSLSKAMHAQAAALAQQPHQLELK